MTPETPIVLIVDDDPAFRDAQRRVLRSCSALGSGPVRVVEAGSGREALEVIGNESVDVVLLDHDMPGGSGLDWLGRLLAARSGLSIIMVTGRGGEQLAVSAMKAGAADYLVKGCLTPADLHRAVLGALQTARLQRTIEQQRRSLLEAERQRVMIESLGAACHHIGQPATIIMALLELMKHSEKSMEVQELIRQCAEAAESIRDILDKLRCVGEYRTVPYLPLVGTESGRTDERILDVGVALNPDGVGETSTGPSHSSTSEKEGK